jgi:hypothetical protein
LTPDFLPYRAFFYLRPARRLRTPQNPALPSVSPPLLPSAIELDQSPFFPQEEFHCGPAALATTLNAAGIGATPEELARQVFLPARRGSLQAEMPAAARRAVSLGGPFAAQSRNTLATLVEKANDADDRNR